MQRINFQIKKEEGIHARPAALIVKLANQFSSNITIEKDGYEVNCKSIMGILELTITCGSHISITAEGEDEEKAVEAIVDLLNSEKLGIKL